MLERRTWYAAEDCWNVRVSNFTNFGDWCESWLLITPYEYISGLLLYFISSDYFCIRFRTYVVVFFFQKKFRQFVNGNTLWNIIFSLFYLFEPNVGVQFSFSGTVEVLFRKFVSRLFENREKVTQPQPLVRLWDLFVLRSRLCSGRKLFTFAKFKFVRFVTFLFLCPFSSRFISIFLSPSAGKYLWVRVDTALWRKSDLRLLSLIKIWLKKLWPKPKIIISLKCGIVYKLNAYSTMINTAFHTVNFSTKNYLKNIASPIETNENSVEERFESQISNYGHYARIFCGFSRAVRFSGKSFPINFKRHQIYGQTPLSWPRHFESYVRF